jgi:hypothetical protein
LLTTWDTLVCDQGTFAAPDDTGLGSERTMRLALIALTVVVLAQAGPALAQPMPPSAPGKAPESPRDTGATVRVGQQYIYQPMASDPDAFDTLKWSLVRGPAGMKINKYTGVVRWSPTSPGGPFTVIIRVSDGRGGVSEQRFTVTAKP